MAEGPWVVPMRLIHARPLSMIGASGESGDEGTSFDCMQDQGHRG